MGLKTEFVTCANTWLDTSAAQTLSSVIGTEAVAHAGCCETTSCVAGIYIILLYIAVHCCIYRYILLNIATYCCMLLYMLLCCAITCCVAGPCEVPNQHISRVQVVSEGACGCVVAVLGSQLSLNLTSCAHHSSPERRQHASRPFSVHICGAGGIASAVTHKHTSKKKKEK